MASRTRTIFIDSVNRKAYSSLLSKITLAMADFFVADEEILQLINCSPNPDQTSPLVLVNNPITGILYSALGIAGQVATAGAFLLTDPVATQVDAGIPFNVAASAFQASLRAQLATHYSACVVTQNGPGDYNVDRVTIGPIATPLTGDGTDLFPACFVNIIPVRVGVAASGPNPGTSDVFRIILNQQPAAYTQSGWVALPAAAVNVQTLVTGSVAPPQNAVFRVTINPDTYQGSFYVTATNLGTGNVTTATSAPIDFASSDVDMQAQIIAGWGTGNEVTVTQVNSYTWDVAFTGANLINKNLGAFSGNASGLSVPVGLQGTLDLRTEAANAMLQGGASKSVYFQVKNTDSGGIPQTWLYVNCTLQPTLISPTVLGSSNIPFPLTEAEADLRYLQKMGVFTGFTGGAGKFDSVVTIGGTSGNVLFADISGTLYAYELISGTATLGTPQQVTPTDHATSGFYWQLIAVYVPVMEPSGAGHAPGLVPDPGAVAGMTKYLREDGTWVVPPNAGEQPFTQQTADFNFSAGDKQAPDTTAGVITGTLPATPLTTDLPIEVIDPQGTHGTNVFTLDPGGNNINGVAGTVALNVNGAHWLIVWVGGATGWRII